MRIDNFTLNTPIKEVAVFVEEFNALCVILMLKK